MLIVWRLRGNIIRTAPCWVVWHNVHSQQHIRMSSSYRSSRLGLSHWDPYAMPRGGCLELYNVFGGTLNLAQSQSLTCTLRLDCLDVDGNSLCMEFLPKSVCFVWRLVVTCYQGCGVRVGVLQSVGFGRELKSLFWRKLRACTSRW